MVELDSRDVKIITHLQANSRKSFLEIAKHCLTSVPTIKSRVERLQELVAIRKFTIDIDNSRLGVPEAVLLINAKPRAMSRIAEELGRLDEVKELYVTSDSDATIVSRISGEMARLLTVQDRINLTDVRVIPIKSAIRNTNLSLAPSSITTTCAYCDKKVTEGAVRKKLDDKDYFFCYNTCLREFDEKYRKIMANGLMPTTKAQI